VGIQGGESEIEIVVPECVELQPLLANEKESEYTVDVKPTAAVHDLYFVLKVESKEAIGIWNTLDIGYIHF
jgi:hypothetical protein